MYKKDISKIVTEGTPNERIKLLIEDRARRRYSNFNDPLLKNKEPLLTKDEVNTLIETFKTRQETRLYNKWNEYDRLIANALIRLQYCRLEVLFDYYNLRCGALEWSTIYNAQQIINSTLNEIEDSMVRKRIAENGIKDINILFSNIKVTPKGYIDIKVDFEKNKKNSLKERLNKTKKRVIRSFTEYISREKAIQDFMNKKGFNIKMYKDIIKVLSKDIYNPVINVFINFPEFYFPERQSYSDEFQKRENILKSVYSVIPVISELEVDNEMLKLYKKNLLIDE